ncbi:MAG: response regulator [Kiloniellales bacterium]
MANILIIDDDEDLRELLRLQLQRAGHEAIVAGDGCEVFNDLPGWVRWADLVITDLFMPQRDGIETLRAFREECSDLPIIVMSGGGRWPDKLDLLDCAAQLGATEILHKPFSRRTLLGALETALASTVAYPAAT